MVPSPCNDGVTMENLRLLLLLSFATSVIGLAVSSVVDMDWLIADGTHMLLIERQSWKAF